MSFAAFLPIFCYPCDQLPSNSRISVYSCVCVCTHMYVLIFQKQNLQLNCIRKKKKSLQQLLPAISCNLDTISSFSGICWWGWLEAPPREWDWTCCVLCAWLSVCMALLWSPEGTGDASRDRIMLHPQSILQMLYLHSPS